MLVKSNMKRDQFDFGKIGKILYILAKAKMIYSVELLNDLIPIAICTTRCVYWIKPHAPSIITGIAIAEQMHDSNLNVSEKPPFGLALIAKVCSRCRCETIAEHKHPMERMWTSTWHHRYLLFAPIWLRIVNELLICLIWSVVCSVRLRCCCWSHCESLH